MIYLPTARWLSVFAFNIFIICSAKGAVLRETFVVSYITGSPDGVWTNNILGINGKFPGPTIEAQLGDLLEVKVINKIQDDQNVSIHWHGIHQKGTPFQDGASQLTQCPLKRDSTQIYQFYLDQTGTYWYHSHVNSQYTEGLWGVLIVHPIKNISIFGKIQDDILLTINDWYHTSAHENEDWLWTPKTLGVPPFPSSVLINGVGRYPCPEALKNMRHCSRWRQQRPVYHVKPGATYKIRLVNTSGYAAFNFTIDNHFITIIEVDGVDVVPVETQAIAIGAGQRYSFLVKFDQGYHGDEYLLRARLREEFLFTIDDLNINKNPNATFTEVTAVFRYFQNISNINSLEIFDHHQSIVSMDSKWKFLKFPTEMTFMPLDRIQAPNFYDLEVTLNISFIFDQNGLRRGTFNGIPFQLPVGKPELIQLFENENNLSEISYNSSSIIPIKYGHVIQVVINNPMLGAHPIHLHGHHFWVMGQGKMGDGAYNSENFRLNGNGYRRDTIMVLEDSWVVLRFRADNVGLWSLHCHVDWHYITGMAVVFVEAPEKFYKLRIPEEADKICKDHDNNGMHKT